MAFMMNQNVDQAVKTFIPEVSIKVDSLPSKSLSYPTGATIKHRPYLFGEVKKVSGSNLSIRDQIDFVLQGVECNFDKLDLTFADALYLGFLRKISTFGTTDILVKFYCSDCDGTKESVIKTDKLNFNEVKAPSFPIITTVCGKEVQFTPMTVRGFYKIYDENLLDDLSAALATCIVGMDFELAYQLISSAPPSDFDVLTEVDRLMTHGLAPVDVTHTVDGIVHKCEVELDGGQALVLPFRETTEPVQSRIRFGSRPPRRSLSN